jgi:hypothetical protein
MLGDIDPTSEPEPKDTVRAAFVAYMIRIWVTWPAVVVYGLVALAASHGRWDAAALVLLGWLVLAVGAFANAANERR